MVQAKNYTATPASNRTNLLGGATWATARTAGITEHQTGKIQSAFSGLYYFHARWYDPVVGRFVGRDPVNQYDHYMFVLNTPPNAVDPTGKVCNVQIARHKRSIIEKEFGHMWIEWLDTSAGWYPTVGYGEIEFMKCKRVPGQIEKPDRHQGKAFEIAATSLTDWGRYEYGRAKGTCCRSKAAPCGDVWDCLQKASNAYGGLYPYYSCMNHCGHFVQWILQKCCLLSDNWVSPPPTPTPTF